MRLFPKVPEGLCTSPAGSRGSALWGATARTPGGGAPAMLAQASEGTSVASLAAQTSLITWVSDRGVM